MACEEVIESSTMSMFDAHNYFRRNDLCIIRIRWASGTIMTARSRKAL